MSALPRLSPSILSATLAGLCLSAAAPTLADDRAAPAGDVNGDGYPDLLVADPDFTGSWPREGRVDLYFGSARGLSGAPAWSTTSGQPFARFGAAMAAAGDLDGDGYGDIAIGAPALDGEATDEGGVLVFRGGPAGPDAAASWRISAGEAFAELGTALAGAGDVNGDGYGDLLVGAPRADAGAVDGGWAGLYLGSADGLVPSPAWSLGGDRDGAGIGASLSAAGDVNGDGYADFALGAPALDRAWLYLGSPTGPAPSRWIGRSGQPDAEYARTLAPAGDLDGDGFADLAVGAPGFDAGDRNEGRVWIYRGSARGLSPLPARVAGGEEAGARFGEAIAAAGDLDGDARPDLAIAAPGARSGERIRILRGAGGAIAGRTPASPGLASALGPTLAGVGDADGDGDDDLISCGTLLLSDGRGAFAALDLVAIRPEPALARVSAAER